MTDNGLLMGRQNEGLVPDEKILFFSRTKARSLGIGISTRLYDKNGPHTRLQVPLSQENTEEKRSKTPQRRFQKPTCNFYTLCC